MDMNKRTIAGIEFEAVRMTSPVPHWRVKVCKTGYIYETGIFSSESRPKLWESMEYMVSRIGAERFAKETLDIAHA